jgi:hypothetical protein
MKTAIGVVLALALMVSVAPATASDTFYAFSTLPTLEQDRLTPLPDDQLAAIEGEGFEFNKCVFCANNAYVSQNNVNVYGKAKQTNRANVHQRIN